MNDDDDINVRDNPTLLYLVRIDATLRRIEKGISWLAGGVGLAAGVLIAWSFKANVW